MRIYYPNKWSVPTLLMMKFSCQTGGRLARMQELVMSESFEPSPISTLTRTSYSSLTVTTEIRVSFTIHACIGCAVRRAEHQNSPDFWNCSVLVQAKGWELQFRHSWTVRRYAKWITVPTSSFGGGSPRTVRIPSVLGSLAMSHTMATCWKTVMHESTHYIPDDCLIRWIKMPVWHIHTYMAYILFLVVKLPGLVDVCPFVFFQISWK